SRGSRTCSPRQWTSSFAGDPFETRHGGVAMNRIHRRTMLGVGLTAVGLVPAALHGQQPKVVQPGQPLNITLTTASAAPDVSIVVGSRSGKVTPLRSGCTHTG